MKKSIRAITIAILSTVLIFLLLSCNDGGGENTPSDSIWENGGETHAHAYGGWETVKAPTCKETGERTRACECGDRQVEILETVAHIESDWIEDKAATVNETGMRYKKCTRCDERLVEEQIHATGTLGLIYEKNSDTTYTITGIDNRNVTEIYIPEYIDGGRVTAIGDRAFKGNNIITKVTVPGTYYIGESAFASCTALTEVKICYGTKCIGAAAFENCKSLKSIDLPESLEKISVHMLYGCEKLEKLVIPSGVESIEDCAFMGLKKLSYLSFPASIKSVGNCIFGTSYDFRYYSLKELHIEDITAWCALDFNNTNEGYGGDRAYCNPFALFSSSDGKLYVNGALITAATTLTIPEGVKTIGQSAFELYPYASISVPNSIVSVGANAFAQTQRLEFNKSDGALYIGNTENPYVVLVYGSHSNSTCEIHPNTKVIMSEAFRECNNLTSIVIPESVISIGKRAFFGCTSLSSVTVINPATEIDKTAFEYCPSLKSNHAE